MSYIYALFSIITWGLAPVIFKYFLPDTSIVLSFVFILFFAGLPGLFNKNIIKLIKNKIFIVNILLMSLFTIIHYFGNFYGIIYGNIILTTLIIKNSPFFQSIIYSILYKKKFKKYNYLIGILLAIGVSLLSYTNNGGNVNALYIIIPLLSSIAWAFLMVLLSKVDNEKETFGLCNFISAIVVLFFAIIFGNINIQDILNLDGFKYIVLILLGIIPTFIGPILWSKSIKKLGDKIIFFDYLTPIITIIFSIILFNLTLNIYNYVGMLLILITLFIYTFLNKKYESNNNG